MSRRSIGLLLLALGLLVPTARAETDLVTIRRSFLTSRDAGALEAALGGTSADRPGAITDAMLAALAANPSATSAGGQGRGYDALPGIVAALRRLDLDAAEAMLPKLAPPAPPASIDRWMGALVATRRGQDREAIRRLRRLPGSTRLGEEEAFRLALLGAALPPDDRRFLAGIGREALLDAAAEGDLEDVERLARRLAALDAEAGAEALCLAARAWERRGDLGRGDAILSGLEASWVANQACMRLERAVWRWRRGRAAEARAAVAGLDLPAGEAWLAGALGRLREKAAPPPRMPTAAVHVDAAHRPAWLIARLETAAGVKTTQAEVEARALALGRQISDPGFAAEVLAEGDLEVLSLAGSTRAADLVLERGRPILLYRVGPEEDRFGDVPVLVWARDPETGFYVGETADLSTRGLVPPGSVARGRLLVALEPKMLKTLGARIAEPDRRLGRRLLDALAQSARGNLRAAESALMTADEDEQALPAYGMYRGYVVHQRYLDTQKLEPRQQDRAALREAETLLAPLLEAQPADPFVLMVTGQSLFARRQKAEAIARFEQAQGAAPQAASIARTRYHAYLAAGEGESALAAIGLARTLAPLDVIALYYRGMMRRRMGSLDEARADLRRAFDREPQWIAVPLSLAALELEALRPKQALAVLEELARRAPDAADGDAVLAAERAAEELVAQRARGVAELAPMLKSRHAETRRHVAFKLSAHETDEAEGLIRRLLLDEAEAVRVTVLRVYMRPWLRDRVEQDPALGREVGGLLRQDASPMVRGAAAGMLSLVRQPWATQRLAEALAGANRDPDPYVRCEAATALGRHDGRIARRALVTALEDPSPMVRKASIAVLFRIAATYMGYDPDKPPEEQQEAIRRWRAWADTE